MSNIQRVSGELGISQTSQIHHLHDLVRASELCFMLPKYCTLGYNPPLKKKKTEFWDILLKYASWLGFTAYQPF